MQLRGCTTPQCNGTTTRVSLSHSIGSKHSRRQVDHLRISRSVRHLACRFQPIIVNPTSLERQDDERLQLLLIAFDNACHTTLWQEAFERANTACIAPDVSPRKATTKWTETCGSSLLKHTLKHGNSTRMWMHRHISSCVFIRTESLRQGVTTAKGAFRHDTLNGRLLPQAPTIIAFAFHGESSEAGRSRSPTLKYPFSGFLHPLPNIAYHFCSTHIANQQHPIPFYPTATHTTHHQTLSKMHTKTLLIAGGAILSMPA